MPFFMCLFKPCPYYSTSRFKHLGLDMETNYVLVCQHWPLSFGNRHVDSVYYRALELIGESNLP